jgi:hypothetical protein
MTEPGVARQISPKRHRCSLIEKRTGHLCEGVKRERVVGRQLGSRAERRAELVQ